MTQFLDTAQISGARRTSDGYLVADVLCARTGCQEYNGADVGLMDGVITVYRPETAVFNKDSMATFIGKPVTIDHPPESVTADNWRTYAVGDIGEEVARDGEYVRVSIKLMDADAIAAVSSGKREISMGYTTPIKMQDGTAPDGTPYQAVQTGPIKINHLAIVDRARGGSKLRIGDDAEDAGKDRANWGASPIPYADKEVRPMADNLQTVVLGDQAVQVSAADTAKIEKFKADSEKAMRDAEASHKAALDAKDAEIATKDAKIEKLTESQVSDADLDKRVEARAALVDTARKIAKDVNVAGLSDADIRKAAVVAKLGDDAVKDKSDAYVEARFDVLAEDAETVKTDPVADALTKSDPKAVATLDTAYKARDTRQRDAWKPKKAEA